MIETDDEAFPRDAQHAGQRYDGHRVEDEYR